jgi:coenzyme PQQ biosynthesis protein PqqD
MLLFPEGALRLQGTGRQILELCEGVMSVQEIVSQLQGLYCATDPTQIRREVISFLEQLGEKRIVDY